MKNPKLLLKMRAFLNRFETEQALREKILLKAQILILEHEEEIDRLKAKIKKLKSQKRKKYPL